jgi:hypothetical protein
MTALCGGGTSSQKLGTAAVVDYSAGLVATLLAEFGGPWMIPLIPLMGLPPLVLATFCSGDPAAMPSFTQAEADALLHFTLGADFNSGLGKLPALLQNIIWNDACMCTSGVYTAAPLPTQPAGSTTLVTPVGATNGPCATVGPFTYAAGHVGPGTGLLQPGLQAAFYRFTMVNTITGGAGQTANLQFAMGTDTGPLFIKAACSPSYAIAPGATLIDIVPACIGYGFIRPDFNAPGGAGASNITITIEAFCGGTNTGGTQQPCCPPDVATSATLATILKLVTEMQRNYNPFGYVLGTAHAGLTGTGTIAVSRLLGAKVAVTAFPGTDVQLGGNPVYVKDLGWMSVSEVDGMIQELRVARTAFTWFPQLMPLADHINYFLQPGVTATITELRPEP